MSVEECHCGKTLESKRRNGCHTIGCIFGADEVSEPKDTLLDEARQFIDEQQLGHSLVAQLIGRVGLYRQQAEINARTVREQAEVIRELEHQRDSAHEELTHLRALMQVTP